jgi:hypothetical protein
VHEHVAEYRKECAADARDHYAAAMKAMSGNQNNSHIEGSYRKLEGRQRVDEKNAARERGRDGKRTAAGKMAQHRSIAFRSPIRLFAYAGTTNTFAVCLLTFNLPPENASPSMGPDARHACAMQPLILLACPPTRTDNTPRLCAML